MAQITNFGQIGEAPVRAVHLTGTDGVRLTLLALGARLTELWVPDRSGALADIVLGHDRLEDYQTHGRYVGATCGRFANRIRGARFRLDGTEHRLEPNEGTTQLHGGPGGFDQAIWDIADHSESHVTFTHRSPAGDMGFPGTVKASCTYRLLAGRRLLIEMTATTDAPTIVNFAHHSYFNLAGHASGDILNHHLQLAAPAYLPVDAAKIPTGEIAPVAGSAYDFTSARRIGQAMPGPDGFDHCFCLDLAPERIEDLDLHPCADLSDTASGRRLRIWTSAVGLQVYTGAHFDGTPGKAGTRYDRFAGVALETQGFPDAPNQTGFPSARLDPGQTYRHLMLCDLTSD